MAKKFLFYISQNYSFEILRPLQQKINEQGDQCAWYAHGKEVNLDNFSTDEIRLTSIEAAVAYKPDAVFVPGNVVPYFISGLKVQVFHGLEYKKKGHFVIRGFFDLYCTQGPITTDKFNLLAKKHQNFEVIETGWTKLDPLFLTKKLNLPANHKQKCILYAPTFSPALTSAVELLPAIKEQIESGSEYWLFKFHPKMATKLLAPYQAIAEKYENVYLSTDTNISAALQTADIILSDTSSVIGEFLLLNKPAITYKNSFPGDELINFDKPELLAQMIKQALKPTAQLKASITQANKLLHPFNDGESSFRVLEATKNMLLTKHSKLKKKPLNLLRKIKLRKAHNYWNLK